MAKDNLVVGLDIGTSKVSVCAGTMTDNGIQILALTSVPHSGLRKGVVTDIEETVSALSQVLEDAERMAGSTITHCYVAVNGAHIEAMPARGVVAIAKPNGEIDQSDVIRVMDAARTVALPQNRELIHIFPRFFTVDSHDEIRDPVGMKGIRLEVEALIVSSASAALRNLTKTVEQAGLAIDGMIFSPLAAARALTNRKQRESGVMIVDIGAGSTSFAIFEEGEILHCASLPIGSMHLTNDIAIGLRTNLDVADTIKLKYGTALPDKVRESEQINLSAIDPAETEKISRRHVAEIIEARILEIFHLIKEELQKVGKDGLLPAGIVFTGGGSDLEGLTELARQHLRLPATIGFPVTQLSGMIDKIDSPFYSTSVGLVLWGLEEGGGQQVPWNGLSLEKFGGVIDKFKGILRNFTN